MWRMMLSTFTEIGGDPAVLVNTTYPLKGTALTDADVSISLDTRHRGHAGNRRRAARNQLRQNRRACRNATATLCVRR